MSFNALYRRVRQRKHFVVTLFLIVILGFFVRYRCRYLQTLWSPASKGSSESQDVQRLSSRGRQGSSKSQHAQIVSSQESQDSFKSQHLPLFSAQKSQDSFKSQHLQTLSSPTKWSIDSLEHELREILSLANDEPKHKVLPTTNITCGELELKYQPPSCNGSASKCPQLRQFLPTDPRDRLTSLIDNRNLAISDEHHAVLRDMQMNVKGQYDLIIVSALSSNHFLESQALLRNLHEVVLPALPHWTVKLVVYDIGLSEEEHSDYQKYCQCKLIKFPFERFPPHFQMLKCFGWKPVVVRAHADSAKYVMWADASVRFSNASWIQTSLKLASIYGVQQHTSSVFIRNPIRALPSIFHFFGDTPCAHLAFTQAESNFGIYRISPLVKDVILDAWAGCGLKAACTCPVDQQTVQQCNSKVDRPVLGDCMRSQSAISIILSKLYMENYKIVIQTGLNKMSIARRNEEDYFGQLKNQTLTR